MRVPGDGEGVVPRRMEGGIPGPASTASDGQGDPALAIPDDATVERVYRALEQAWCKGREGPYGLYNYTSYGWSNPHRVRDFRDPRSSDYGQDVFVSETRERAEAEYQRLTRRHIVTAVVRAVLADGVGRAPRPPVIDGDRSRDAKPNPEGGER